MTHPRTLGNGQTYMQLPDTAWPVLSGWAPPLADAFVARQETGLSQATGLAAGETVVIVPDGTGEAPWALGGTGKTSLAAALAHAHWRQRMADLVLWVTGTSRDAVISGYVQALRDIGMTAPPEDPEGAAVTFLAWLRQTRQPWLVVCDELVDPLILEELWPRGPAGRVLVTTNDTTIAGRIGDARQVPLGAYSPREGLQYLFGRLHADPGQRIGALDLAGALGQLPVPLAQATAVMADTGMDCREYLARAAAAEAAPAAMTDAAGGSAPLIGQAWSLSAGYASQLPPGGLAWRVLLLLSVLAPTGIPGALLTGEAAQSYLLGQTAATPEAAAPIRAAVHNLSRAGLVTIDANSAARTILVHPTVQTLTWQRLTAGDREQVARAAGSALVQAWLEPGMPAPVALALRECTAQLREMAGPALWLPECQQALLRAGQSLDLSRMTGSAAEYWRMMLAISQQGLGADHPQTIRVSELLGAACQAAGRHDESIAVYRGTLAERERSLGPTHPGTLSARLNLARAWRAAGRSDEAVRLAAQTASQYEQAAGPGHPDSLAAREELVRSCLSAGRVGEAVAAAEHIRAAWQETLGPDHPDTLAAGDLLADTYLAAKRFKEALACSRRVLADRERLFGPEHPDTLTARARLALTFRLAKKLKDAIAHYESVLADRERLQGADHPDVINARAALAVTCYEARKFPQAIAHYERVMADAERTFGPGHPRTRQAQEDLAAAAAGAQSVLGIDLRSPVRRG